MTKGTIRDDLVILILGSAAAMNADLHRTIAFLDAQLRAVIEVIPRLPRLTLAKRRNLAELAQRIDGHGSKPSRASSPSTPSGVGTAN